MSVISPNTHKILALSALQGVGAKTLNSLGKLKNFNELSLMDVAKSMKVTDISSGMINDIVNFANVNIDLAEKFGHKIISQFDIDYPNLLKLTDDAPALLYCAGDVGRLNEKCLAIIGTREPTEHGAIIAHNISKWFSDNDWNIVSGLAKGVDSIAHKATFGTNSKTIAVMAQGLEKVYPSENKYLAQDILEHGGVLVSEYAYKSPTFRTNFVQRDRIQAGLSAGVIMVQSDINGGSLHASRSILKYGRYLIIPNQSERDIYYREPKIQANMILSRKEHSEIMSIIKNKSIDINNIIIMKNRDEYHRINDFLKRIYIREHNSRDNGFDF